MNRLVERDRDGGHPTWSRAESPPPPRHPAHGGALHMREGFFRRHKVNDGEGAGGKKKDADIIAENFQAANVILKV